MTRVFAIILSAGMFLLATGSSPAGEPRVAKGKRSTTVPAAAAIPALNSSDSAIDVLEAESQGLVSVRYIPNDSRSAQIVVVNRSHRPLTLRLPAGFTGVPVLAQFGGGMGMGNNNNNNVGFGAAGQPQTAGGGGLGQQGMNGGMAGQGVQGGGGAFSIQAEKTRVLRVTTVCLEHGKPEPSSRYPYKLASLESFSNDPTLAVVLESLSRGELSQRVAQAAAWHIANGLTWQQVEAKIIDHAGSDPDEPFFSPAELSAAHQVVSVATQVAQQRSQKKQPVVSQSESAAK